MNILLIVMGQSPFNRSIWTGFGEAFQALGHEVQGFDARDVPIPESLSNIPDLVLSIHGFNTPVDIIHKYRSKKITTAVYLLDEPYETDHSINWSQHYDIAFSVDRATLPAHRKLTRAEYLPLAYNDKVFFPRGSSTSSRILVLGSPFEAREQYLKVLYEKWENLITWVGPGWNEIYQKGVFHEEVVSPQECASFYRGADIVINIHRDSDWSHFGNLNKNKIEATHLNPRFWEAGACRSLQLCSYREDINKYGTKEIVFKSTDELAQKVGYYLDNESARAALADTVYNMVKPHTYVARCQTLLDNL